MPENSRWDLIQLFKVLKLDVNILQSLMQFLNDQFM